MFENILLIGNIFFIVGLIGYCISSYMVKRYDKKLKELNKYSCEIIQLRPTVKKEKKK